MATPIRSSPTKSPLRRSRSRAAGGSGGYCSLLRMLLLIIVMATIGVMMLSRELSILNNNAADNMDYIFDSPPGVSYFLDRLRGFGGGSGSIMPIDLSVNQLRPIKLAGGALPSQVAIEEDFLPIVESNRRRPVQLRFRLQPVVGAFPVAIQDISAYQIIAKSRNQQSSNSEDHYLWKSEKILTPDGMPISIPWGGDDDLVVGTIVEWKVMVWDSVGKGPVSSDWSKFGVGPSESEWEGKWISHPNDIVEISNPVKQLHWLQNIKGCEFWKRRRPLPIMRSKFALDPNKHIASALLVMTAPGTFHVTLDGKPLSSASAVDPALTDFTQRVFYRGYDVTSLLAETDSSSSSSDQHVIGVVMGSGWFDARPLTGGIILHHFMARGSLTTVAELHVTYQDGSRQVLAPSGETNEWQVAKGFVRDSDLFTGDTLDLGLMKTMEGWDTPSGWTDTGSSSNALPVQWVTPGVYKAGSTTEEWRAALNDIATNQKWENNVHGASPMGKRLPSESPPVLPIERIPVESMWQIDEGRWILDFGKAMSGVVRFEGGLPEPIKPKNGYPIPHNITSETNPGDRFISVVYAESLKLETGAVNRALVAAHGLHDDGGKSKDVSKKAGPCWVEDHDEQATQRDVFIVPPDSSEGSFSDARQAMFTTHGFRFAEICCIATPPQNAYAILYRTAVPDWGQFDSSNIQLNGGYELTKNAFNSNMLSVQSDCPHREKLQYGGDLLANSPAALHFFDASAFYSKVIHDFTYAQWDNGAYTEMSSWMNLLQERGIGKGAGETVWAALPPVLTARHYQHYGDMDLISETFDHHVNWIRFLKDNWERGMKEKFPDLERYNCCDGGLSDWLSLVGTDTYLAHNAYFLASSRAVSYLGNRLHDGKEGKLKFSSAMKYSLGVSDGLVNSLNTDYMKEDRFRLKKENFITPGPDLGLYARVVPGHKRCTVLMHFLRQAASSEKIAWDAEESAFYFKLNKADLEEELKTDRVINKSSGPGQVQRYQAIYRRRHSLFEGIFSIRFTLKVLSDMGLHDVALSKAAAVGFPSFDYMMSHNATTMWETWYRSEGIFSRNHPMFGAVAEWLSSSVAGVSLSPTTIGGQELLFWPRFPTHAKILQYASATQGTKRGDAAIAWEFLDLPQDKNQWDDGECDIHIRVLVPPGSTAKMRLPYTTHDISISSAKAFPNIDGARQKADDECQGRRRAGEGYPFNWEFDRKAQEWRKEVRRKAIGTPCRSFLLGDELNNYDAWSDAETIPASNSHKDKGMIIDLNPGVYDVRIPSWKLVKEIPDEPGYEEIDLNDLGPECADPSTFEWNITDATHLI